MPRSSGTYSLPPGYAGVPGTNILVSQHNPPLEDIAQALTDSLPRDGSAPMVGQLAMGGNRITNLGAAVNASDAVRFDQLSAVTTLSAWLTSVSLLALGTNEMVYASAPNTASKTTLSAFMRTMLDDADAATARATMGVRIGTDVQAFDADLSDLSALTFVRGDIIRRGASALERLPLGANGQVLKSNGSDVVWGAAAASVKISDLEPLTAGSIVRYRRDAVINIDTISTESTLISGYGFIQGGTVRITLEHRSSNCSTTVRVYRTRAGVETLVQSATATASGTYTARSFDVTVQTGDIFRVTHQATSLTGTPYDIYARNIRIQTNGEQLWPSVDNLTGMEN